MSRAHADARDAQRAQDAHQVMVPGHGPVTGPVYLCLGCRIGLMNTHPSNDRCRVCGAKSWGRHK